MTPKQIERLRKLMQRALGEDGIEASSALRLVRGMMKMHRVDADWVLAKLGQPPAPILAPLQLNDVYAQVGFLSMRHVYLNDRELGFVVGLEEKIDAGKRLTLTLKQQRYLRSIYARVNIVAYQQQGAAT